MIPVTRCREVLAQAITALAEQAQPDPHGLAALVTAYYALPKARQTNGKADPTYTKDFEAIWAVWPNKAAKAEAAALWNALEIEQRRVIYKHVVARLRSDPQWQKQVRDQDFKLHLRTFLSQRRYEDDYATPAKAPPSLEPQRAVRCAGCGERRAGIPNEHLQQWAENHNCGNLQITWEDA